MGPDKTICTNERIYLDPLISNVSYQWNTGEISSRIQVTKTGLYWLRATNQSNSCFTADTILIKDKPFPVLNLGNDTLVCETEELLLKTGLGAAATGINFLWQDGNTSPAYKVKSPGVYSVRASNNCTIKYDTITVSFKVCPLGIPNAFSPNGDGRNERFRAKYGAGITNYRIQIYNRFGQMVFTSSDQLLGWDGAYNGKSQPAGTYAWAVLYKDAESGKIVNLKGTVILIR